MGTWSEDFIKEHTTLKRTRVTEEEATETGADGVRVLKNGYYAKTKDSGETVYYSNVETIDYDKAQLDISMRDSHTLSVICWCVKFFVLLTCLALFFLLWALAFQWYNYNFV